MPTGAARQQSPEMSSIDVSRSATALPPEVVDLLALSLVPGLGPRLTTALLERFGSAAAVRRLSAEQLMQVPHIGERLAPRFVAALRDLPLERELALVAEHRVRLLIRGDAEYPAALAELPDAPPLLYSRGTVPPQPAVAIVGSRQCSAYGRRVAQQIAAGLTRAGFAIVSGMALGIDGAAHEGALQAGGKTIAVLAGGLSSIYPPQHLELSRSIEQSGCLLSETPMSLPPQAGMFPARNRIISGLSRAVVVIEAGERSGALITASHAIEQGRELFVVPGPVDSPFSAGSLRLLRDGARLVRHADDILEDLAGLPLPGNRLGETEAPPNPQSDSARSVAKASAPTPSPVPPSLDGDEKRVWDALGEGALAVDELVRRLGLSVARLQGLLMSLELKRCVRRLPGNVLERC